MSTEQEDSAPLTRDKLSSEQLEELVRLSGSSPTLQAMLRYNFPLTRETWLGLNYGDQEVPDPVPPEVELEIPEFLRNR